MVARRFWPAPASFAWETQNTSTMLPCIQPAVGWVIGREMVCYSKRKTDARTLNALAGWERLLESIAPDALHNSKTRQNAPKCDGDTHVKVTGEIMDWIQERNAPQRILCLKGAAGAGKSTPQQTLEAGQRSLSRQRQYPKTSSDFLNAESRAKALVVSESRVVTHLTKCCMQRIIESPLDFNCRTWLPIVLIRIHNPSVLVPARWDELPLPLLSRESLREAIDNLPFLLNEAVAVDDEVSGFTRNGGWQKISKLVPLMCHLGGSYFIFSDRWINVLGEYTDKLRVSDFPGPSFEVASDITYV